MSKLLLPESIDPFRLAEKKTHLVGSIPIFSMSRLCESLSRVEQQPAQVDLTLTIDEQGVTVLQGRLIARLVLQCQRCTEPFICEIMSNLTLGIVNTLDEADRLPGGYEAVLTKEGQVVLGELVENELILNLPIIPKHPPDTCKVRMPLLDMAWEEEAKNPFQVLSSLKHYRKLKQED